MNKNRLAIQSPVRITHYLSQPKVAKVFSTPVGSPIIHKQDFKIKILNKCKLNKTMRNLSNIAKREPLHSKSKSQYLNRTQIKSPKVSHLKNDSEFFLRSRMQPPLLIKDPSSLNNLHNDNKINMDELFRRTSKEFSSFAAIRIQGLLTKKWCEYTGQYKILSGISRKMNERLNRILDRRPI